MNETQLMQSRNNNHQIASDSSSSALITNNNNAKKQKPTWLAQSIDIEKEGNFPQGCSFSPDGLCIATATAADATLRLYNTIHECTTSGDDDDDDEALPNTKPTTTTTTTLQSPKKQPKSWKTALSSNVVGDVIRSYDWYPLMKSNDPSTCCILATGRDQPVQCIDAYTGKIRATYVPINIAMEEMESPTVVKFSPWGDKIITAGYKTDRMIQIFDSAIPGKNNCTTTIKLGKTKKSNDGQKGLISALAFNNNIDGTNHQSPLLAVGTYSPGSIYLYDFRQGGGGGGSSRGGGQQPAGTIWSGCCIVGHGKNRMSKKRRFHDDDNDDNTNSTMEIFSQAKTKWYAQRAQRGITQLQFDTDGKLYSASRNSDSILVWDVRMLSGNSQYANLPIRGYTSYPMMNNGQAQTTNQRIEFALDDTTSRLFVGGYPPRSPTIGNSTTVRVYDTSPAAAASSTQNNNPLQEEIPIPGCAMGDAINGVSYNATYDMLAIATGSRRFPTVEDYDDDDDDYNDVVSAKHQQQQQEPPGSLQLYKWNTPR